MKKSLFSKLIATYVLVILLSIGIVSSLSYAFFNNYYFEIKEEQLISQGMEMSQIINPYLKNKEFKKIDETINTYNKVNISHMWVTNKEGYIISGYKGLHANDSRCPDETQLQKALKGKVVSNRGNINYADEPVLSVALPIYENNQVQGAIFACNPLSDINTSIAQTSEIVLFAGIIAIFIVAFVSYFISKTITRPIKEITEISLEMTKGNFTKSVKVTSSDEVGELGKTFNFMMLKLDKSLRDLEKEKNKMAEMERMQREFVANASHELRTPLTSVRGYLEAILDGIIKEKEEERKYLRIILKETLRLHRLVNSLLDLSKIESRQIRVDKKELSITEVIDRTAIKLKPLIDDQQLYLEIDMSKDLPKVFTDEDLVEQVLINYITNAIRFTPEGGKISVKVDNYEDKVNIHVIDTGIGISPEDLPKIWKRFYKVDEARALSKQGSGLGLSLVKEIMELLGGTAWVKSTQGEGSVFSFSLPVNKCTQQKSLQMISIT